MPPVGTKVRPVVSTPVGEFDHWKPRKVKVTHPDSGGKVLVDARVYGVLLVYEDPLLPGRWLVGCDACSPDCAILGVSSQVDAFRIGDVLQRKATLHIRRLQTQMDLKTGFTPWIFSWLAACSSYKKFVDPGQFERGEVEAKVG